MATAYPSARPATAPGLPIPPRCLACANCCVVFATSGVLFLSFIGFLLHRQPLYVLGVGEPAKASERCEGRTVLFFHPAHHRPLTLAYDRASTSAEVESGQWRSPRTRTRRAGRAATGASRRRADRAAAPAPAVGSPSLLDTDLKGGALAFNCVLVC